MPTAGRAALYAALAEAISEEASRVRQAHGVGPLSSAAALDRAALQHAQELAGRRLLDHRGQTQGRETLQQRINAAGVVWSGIGENLASIPGAARHLAEDVVYLWLNSPGHRANLLNAMYTHVGTGVTRDAEGHWYVVQVYVRPRG